MLTRIGAALLALYLIHGHDQTVEEGGRMVASLREEAPRAALLACAANPDLCRRAVTGSLTEQPAPMLASAADSHMIAVEAPLPPRRPRTLQP